MMESGDETIWKGSFFKDNFNVDQCLSKYTQKTDLETLRNDLKAYGNELHQQMSEILKTETEAIVNLAEYLTNLNSKIEDLALPLSQLREEIKLLYDLIKSAKESYHQTLESIQNNNTRHNYLNLKSGIISSAIYIDNMIKLNEDDLFNDSVVLERAVNKFSFEYNYLEIFGLSADVEEISIIGNKLTEMINTVFLKSIRNDDEVVMLRCLQMYDNLGQVSEAERTYQVNVVRPALQDLFTESYLETCNQDLTKIYSEALSFIDVKITPLLDILKRSGELKSFNFVLNSFWVEVDKLSREGLPHVTAPGNPELFQKRFKTTWDFLAKIAEKCGDQSLIKTHSSFVNHIKRFNLPVYFEIRFQQIASQFESEAIKKSSSDIYATSNEINCKLKLTLTLWKSLLISFDSEVFIDNLADQFLKLSMLLLARYLKWFEMALEEADLFTEGSEAWEDFIIHSLNDLEIVKTLLGDKSNLSVYTHMPPNVQTVLVDVFELNTKTITNITIKLQNHLITIKSNECLTNLQNVAAIPRLYRRTNRSAPREASNYMIEAIQSILKFHNKYKSIVKNEMQEILDTVISNITKQYLLLVDEVLRSVCKTEESLRRLKNRNAQISETASDDPESSDKMSDEMKIREQIKLDVHYFIEKLYHLALDNAKKSMDELRSQTC